jgi:diguanylate cyclase (GGDEF)-like protein
MPPIKREWCEIAYRVILEAQERITVELTNPLVAALPGISIQELASDFFRKMRELLGFAGELSISLSARSSESPELNVALVPLFKAIFLTARLAKARELDAQRPKTPHPLILAAFDEKLKVYDGIIREEWFQTAVPEYPPSLSDMLTLEQIENRDTGSRFSERQYDEKFRLLQAPTLFLSDLHYYRGKCGVRGIPVAIAFLDIDKFKDFNSEVGETHVDRHVLPLFMKAVEAHIYGHGYAYRYGGDEYAVIMPNADADLALAFVNGLRRRVGAIHFLGTQRTITVSVGLCVADRDCFLTDGELLQKAEQAKNFAKKQGRDCVAGYAGKLFDESELRVLTPTTPNAT